MLQTVLQMIEQGATHVGVATDHVIESFRNDLWPGYKTGEGIEPALLAQFHPLEDALAAMGVAVWPMVELEADDALASAAHLARADRARREGLHLDAGQGSRAMRGRRSRRADGPARSKAMPRCSRRAREVRRRADAASPTTSRSSATPPTAIPGIDGIGAVGAAQRCINRYGAIEDFPPEVLAAQRRELALLFKRLATLRTDAPLFSDVEALRWRGPTEGFEAWAARIGDARLLARSRRMVDSVH